MKAVIMAGGRGERLKPLTDNVPKPLLPVLNKPIIEYIVCMLRDAGITDIAVTLGYRKEQIKRQLKSGAHLGVNIVYFEESSPLGTAGGVKNCSPFLDSDFLVLSGDAFTDIDLKEFINCHFIHKKIGTLCVKEVDDINGFGVVKINSSGTITEFIEKPERSVEKTVNTGIYAFKTDILKIIPTGFCDFGRDIFPRLVGKLHAYKTDKYWNDVGTLNRYYNTNLYISENLKIFPYFQ